MTEEAKKIVEAIKEAFEVLSAMELPAEEQKIEITRDAAMTLIAELSQAEPVRHGWWRRKLSDCYWPGDVICSECNKEYSFSRKPKYCPNCGAKMDAEVER